MMIIGDGGNAAHLPDHSIEACLSAYTAGADGLMLTVQKTSDGHFMLYRHDDLSVGTDGQGHIENTNLAHIMEFDAGAKFQIGLDTPWTRNANHTFLRLGRLEDLLRVLEDNVRYFIRPSTARIPNSDRMMLMDEILTLFARTNRVPPIAAIEVSAIAAFQVHFAERLKMAVLPDGALTDADIAALRQNPPSYVFTPPAQHATLSDAFANLGCTCIASLTPDDLGGNLPSCGATQDVSAVQEASGNVVTGETETWTESAPDHNRWVLGVSSGHHVMGSMAGTLEFAEEPEGNPVLRRSWLIDNPFPASATTGDGLHIAVVEGTTYASAGAVSRFSLGSTFTVDVDFTYDNPQVSNMMVLAVINQEVWPSYYHRPGVRDDISPMIQNHAFDTHGAAPFVSMEREEDDGFRIMKYTSAAGVYEWYGNFYLGNVGNPQSTAGRLRLERRGRFFTGYYQDENNSDWVGVGTMENASMNDRVYLRLGAKHYPKGGGPDVLFPLNVSFTNLKTLRPAGPVVQETIPSNLDKL